MAEHSFCTRTRISKNKHAGPGRPLISALLLVIAFIYLVAPKGAVCFVYLFINLYFSVGPLRWEQVVSKLFADLSLASNSFHRLKIFACRSRYLRRCILFSFFFFRHQADLDGCQHSLSVKALDKKVHRQLATSGGSAIEAMVPPLNYFVISNYLFVERSDYLWNEVTIFWNEVTVRWNEVTRYWSFYLLNTRTISVIFLYN